MGKLTPEQEAILKVAISIDEAEVRQVMEEYGDQIDAGMKAAIEAQLAMNKAARRSDLDDLKKFAGEEVKTREQTTKKVTASLKEQREVHATTWRQHLQDLSNATIAVRGAYDVYAGLKARVGEFAEEVARTTQIFNSQHVSIEKAKAAVQGTVSSMDLIIAANKATQLELNLTAEQFATVARRADDFADSTGTDTKAALDSLISGLANGQVKMLRSAGVVFDVDTAYKDFADTLRITTDRLSDTGKKLAIQEAALKAMGQAGQEAADGLEEPRNMAMAIEQAIAASKDRWDEFVVEVGSFEIPPEVEDFWKTLSSGALEFAADAIWGLTVALPHAFKIAKAKIKDLITGGDERYEDQERAEYGRLLEQRERRRTAAGRQDIADEKRRAAGAPFGPLEYPGDRKSVYSRSDLVQAPKGSGKSSLEYTGIERLLAAAEQLAANQRADDLMANNKAEELERLLGEYDNTHAGGGAAADVERFGRTFEGGLASSDDFMAAQGKAMESIARMEQAVAASREKVGGGIMGALLFGNPGDVSRSLEGEGGFESGEGVLGRMLFGEDGLNRTFDQLTLAEQRAVSMFEAIGAAGDQMANALGAALAAAIGEDSNFAASWKERTHAVAMGISQQAFAQAALEGAQALVSVAIGGPVGGLKAAQHATAAAALTAAGVFAGGIARATFSPPPATTGAGTGGVAATPRDTGGAGAGGGSGRGGGDVYNFNFPPMLPGMEEIVGRSIVKALKAERLASGRDIIVELSA